jgi:hypothetical protein
MQNELKNVVFLFVALVFSNVLIPKPPHIPKESESVLKKKTQFIQYFLNSFEEFHVI